VAAENQSDLLYPINDLALVRLLLADLHDDLPAKVARFRQLADLSGALGSYGTLMPGGETTYAAWTEARASFIHGNYVATVLLCQGLAEHLLAAHLACGLDVGELPPRISFRDTLTRCLAQDIITKSNFEDLECLMNLRNPLSHYRGIGDPSNLSRRAIDSKMPTEDHLRIDASFAISVAIRLLSLPVFRLEK